MWKYLSTSLGTAVLLFCLSAAGRVAAGEEPAGQKLFIKNKCSQCHTIDALKISKEESEEEEEEAEEGEKKVDPPDLSGAGKEREAAWIVKWLKKLEKVEGRKHKKKFKGSEEELQALSEWLATLKVDVPKKKGQPKPDK